ncbi:heat-inducible transcription repressor HrcA, partial [Bifidobacteriaceae bacterium VN002]
MQSRRMMILRAVVEDYIRSHEPVGSASLAKNHKLGVSSATIRNDMSLLEEEGYLIQPHTSAGRIPTEKGYRYFVDGLAALIPLSNAQRRGIRTFLSGSVSLQDTLQRSARLLASITGQVALVASPALSKSKVKRIEIVQVSSSTLLVVVITDAGGVAQHIIQASNINPDDLLHLVNMVNESCVGASLLDASKRVYLLANRKDLASALQVISQLANALEDMHNGEHSYDLYMAGASQLAHRQNIGDFASLFDALEEQAVIMRLMTSLSEEANDCASGVSVAIGSETHTPGLLNASVVTS